MKKALSVGINYAGTGNDLKGCINDSNNMKAMLEGRGFEVKLVLEKEATTQGIKDALEWLVAGTVPGDVIVFHYSGHGSQIPSKAESDGFEEIICPIDLNWRDKIITDDTLRQIFDKVPNGVNVTVFLDCCHSGTMLDQTQSTVVATKGLEAGKVVTKSRNLSKKKGSRYLKPPVSVLKKLKDKELVNWAATKDVNATAMLIAACRADQTSADATISGIFQGAGTASLLKSVNANPNITYKQLVDEMNNFMVSNRFTQRPELDGSFGLHNEVFLSTWTMFMPPVVEPEIPQMLQVPVVARSAKEKKDNTTKIAIVAGIALIVFFAFFA